MNHRVFGVEVSVGKGFETKKTDFRSGQPPRIDSGGLRSRDVLVALVLVGVPSCRLGYMSVNALALVCIILN